MKCTWIKYFSLVWAIVLFTGCKNGGEKPPAGNNDPVFQSDPKLKNITDQINSNPKDAGLYYTRGVILHRMQYDSLALKDYKTAASLDTTQAEYYSAIGDLLFENKDITGSVEWLRKALEKNPADKKARLKIAKMFLYIRDFQNGFKEVNNVLIKDVHNPEAYFLKGMMYRDMKDTAKAISSFLTAIQENPDYHDAMVQLALLYNARHDVIGLKYLDNAYKLDTMDVFPIFAKGVYYQEHKDYEAAKEEYKKCIMRNRHYSDAYFNMGVILLAQDSVQKAWRQYNIVTKNDPMNPAGYYNRGVCSELMDSVKNAVADYKMALSLDSTYQSPKAALARLGSGRRK